MVTWASNSCTCFSTANKHETYSNLFWLAIQIVWETENNIANSLRWVTVHGCTLKGTMCFSATAYSETSKKANSLKDSPSYNLLNLEISFPPTTSNIISMATCDSKGIYAAVRFWKALHLDFFPLKYQKWSPLSFHVKIIIGDVFPNVIFRQGRYFFFRGIHIGIISRKVPECKIEIT